MTSSYWLDENSSIGLVAVTGHSIKENPVVNKQEKYAQNPNKCWLRRGHGPSHFVPPGSIYE